MLNLLLSSTTTYVWISIFVIIAILFAVFIGTVPMGIYVRALVSGSYISAARLIGMRLRHVDVKLVVNSYINAKKAGVSLKVEDLETHYMSGGNVSRVVEALITAKGAKLKLSVETAKGIDLANRDVLVAVQNSVKPVVITTPFISAVAKNGIELLVKARVTVKTNMDRLIGGAGEDTIIARIGEGIITTVGSAKNQYEILENPDIISKTMLEKGLDEGTAFDILSVDIGDIDVGRNIGAKIQAERAEADMKIANAHAEERRSMAIAAEHEMRAKTQEKRAKLIEAESEIPKAISTAFNKGNIGVMDYYRMQNVVADTSMRSSFATKTKIDAIPAISQPTDNVYNPDEDDNKK